MLARTSSLFALAALAVARPLSSRDSPALPNADIVCASNGCMLGQSAVSAGVKLVLATNASIGGSQTARTVLFLPAAQSYSASSSLRASNGTFSLGPIFAASTGSQTTALPGFVNTGSTASTVQSSLDPAARALYFSSSLFFGQVDEVTASNTTIQLATSSVGSLILPNSSYAILQVGSVQLVASDSTADLSQWSAKGQLTLLDAQSTSCAQPCGIGGTCSLNGTCVCRPGFVGILCDACQPGTFGSSCSTCACSSGSTCDDGITGTGRCSAVTINTTTPAVCGCTNGVCSGSNSCTCNAGWADAPSSTPSQSRPSLCSVCAQGFYLSSTGDCLACQAGCSSCTATKCNSCRDGLETSQNDATVCVPTPARIGGSTSFSTCPDGSFNSNGRCVACDSTCSTCFGAGSNSCLVCAEPRVLLGQSCVNVDQASGVCNTPSGTNGQYVVDNNKKLCDALPAKCTAGSIPSFAVTSTRSDLQCSSCVAGSALLPGNGTCVAACPSGQFVSANATCTTCDPSCASCNGAGAQSCTTCPSGSLLLDGTCVKLASCPIGTFANSTSTCAHCSPECTSCSGNATTCTACPSSRPVLTASGRCVATCARGSFISGSTCQRCSSNCATCSGSVANQCLSCPDGQVLRSGTCQPANCLNGASTIPGLGVCLESLLTLAPTAAAPASSSTSSPVGAIIGSVVGALMLLLLVLYCCRRRARKRRAQKTEAFAAKRSLPALFSGSWLSALKRRLRHDRPPEQPAPRSSFGPSKEWQESKMVISYPLELQQEADRSPVVSLYSKHSRNPFYAMPGVRPPVEHRTGVSEQQSIGTWTTPASVHPEIGQWTAGSVDARPISLLPITPSEANYPPHVSTQRFPRY